MNTLAKIVGAVVLIIAFLVILCLILTIPLWLLWNWLVPIVFPGEFIVHHITLLQAFGILLLSGILFKSSASSSKSS